MFKGLNSGIVQEFSCLGWLVYLMVLLDILFPMLSHAGLQIISPRTGIVVAPGNTIHVVVAVDGGTTFSEVQVIIEGVGFSVPLTAPPYEFDIPIPTGFLGLKNLKAVGITSRDTDESSPPVVIDIEGTFIVTGLQTTPSSIKFAFAGQEFPLRIMGLLADGTQVDVSKSSRTSYTSADPSVARVDSSGLVTAVGQGTSKTTKIMVQYQGKTLLIPVTVPQGIKGDLNSDGRVDQDDVNIILDFRNTPATGPFDARDLNKDGMIDALDASQLILLCTRPRCETH